MKFCLLKRLGQYVRGFAISILCGCLLVIAIAGNAPNAIAMPNQAADIVMSRAAAELDDNLGAGTSDQIEGKVQQDIGTVKKNIGEVTGKVEGTVDQVKGKVNRDIGRTKAAAEDAVDEVDEASSGFIESLKDVFE